MTALRDLVVHSALVLPKAALEVRFARSGGPGGQHVNKVETKVDLRLDLLAVSGLLGEDRLRRIRTALAARIDGEDRLQVVSSEHKSQSQNLEAALVRMEALIRDAVRPRKVRRKTTPTRSSQRRRVDAKKRRGEIKRQRRDRPESA